MKKMGFGEATQLLGVAKAVVTACRDAIILETTHLAITITKAETMANC